MALPQDTTTIEEFIKSGVTVPVSYDNLSFLNKLSNGTYISIHNVVSDYLDELKNASVMVELSQEEYRKYKYKPKLLCYDIYGNAEAFFIILLMNNMADIVEFNKQRIKMLRKDYMNLLVSYIINAESPTLESYNN